MAQASAIFTSSIGRKTIVAVTGAGMVLFLLGHMLGNLKIFKGPDAINAYAELLRVEPGILWAIRLGLLALVALHVIFTIQLTLENRRARPVKYVASATQVASAASRMMIYGGVALGLYIVYHILHFTTRSVHVGLVGNEYTKDHHVHADVYANVVNSFQDPIISAVYVVAQVFLFFHLYHGVLSAFRTLGVDHPRYLGMIRTLGIVVGIVICAGFTAVPVAVLAGVVK